MLDVMERILNIELGEIFQGRTDIVLHGIHQMLCDFLIIHFDLHMEN